jgi:hypothetical protein
LRSLTTPSKGARVVAARQQLLARRHHARAGGDEVALRVVAAHLGVFQRLHRGHALGLQRLQACHLALGLLEGLAAGAHGLLGRAQAVADAGVIQPHDEVAGAHRLAVVLEHLLHHGTDLGAQIGATLRLQRAADHRPGGLLARAERAQVLHGQQQHGLGGGGRAGGCGGLVRRFAAGGEECQPEGGGEACLHGGSSRASWARWVLVARDRRLTPPRLGAIPMRRNHTRRARVARTRGERAGPKRKPPGPLRDPAVVCLVGASGLEPPTPTMSRWCSNQLS